MPATALLAAVVVTQIIATLITVYGILLTPMGWTMAGFIWLEAAVVFVLIDCAKVRLYRVLDHSNVWFRRR